MPRVRVQFPDYLKCPPNQSAKTFVGEFDPSTGLVAVEEIPGKEVPEPFAVHVASGAVMVFLPEKGE